MLRRTLILILPAVLLLPAFAGEEVSESETQPEKTDESLVKIITVEETLVLSLSMKGSYDQHQEAIGRLMAYADTTDVQPDGMPYGRYFNSPMEVAADELLWEVGIPVAAEVAVEEPFQIATLPGGLIASATHVGPYEQSAMMFPMIMGYMNANGYQFAGAPYETWYGDPNQTGENGPRTEIRIPVTKIGE